MKNISRNKSIKVSDKCSQNILDHAKQSATYALKTTSKKVVQKIAEETVDLTGNKIADKLTKVPGTLSWNILTALLMNQKI